ncbi:MAG: malectin domain-containing carbohydrate-binding protein [Actinomycetota bacterium]
MQQSSTRSVRRCACPALLTLLLLSLVSLASHGRGSATAAGGIDPVVGGSLAGVQVFPPDNPWNRDISGAPVDPNSANLVASIGLTDALHPDFGTSYNGRPWGIPFVTVSGSQPKVPITFTQWPGESDPGPYPTPLDAPIEGGPNSSGDRHVIVVDRDNQRLYELFNAFPTGSGWNASCGAAYDLRSNAVRPAGWTSADAAGLPILPGLVRYEEAAELREIRHALRFTATRTRRAYVYPARHYASTLTDPNLPPMGTRVRLKASFNVSTYPPTMQVILRALQRYGMILADNGGDWFLSGAPDPRWNDAEIETLKRVRGQDFEVIQLGYPGPPSTTVPAAPTGLVATAGSARVDLRWNASSGATGYNVKRSLSSTGGFTTIGAGVTATTFADTGVADGSTYHYVVSAVGGGGESANSAAASATPSASDPGAGATTHRINCGGPAYSSAAAGVWSAERYASGGSSSLYGYRDIANTTDEGLYLRVRFGKSFRYDLPAQPGSYKLKLHFAECWFTAAGLRRFNVSVNGAPVLANFDPVQAAGGGNRAIVQEVPITLTGTTVSVAFQSLLNDAVVSAIELLPATGGTSPPAAPAGLQAIAGDGRVALQWSAAAGAASYTVKRSLTAGGVYAVIAAGVSTTAYTDTGLTNGAAYFYTVAAVGAGGESGPSTVVSATPRASGSTGVALRINCGGMALTDQAGVPWSSERHGVGGGIFTYSPRDISGTADDYRYYTVRYSSGANFGYSLPAAAGSYTLKLHFAECWFTTPGSRVFNVRVNGALALANLDVVAAAGGANTTVVRTLPVTSTGNGVTVLFENVRNGPIISAIELVPES